MGLVMETRTNAIAIAAPLAALHITIGLLFTVYAVVGVVVSHPLPHAFLVSFGNLALGWALLLDRRWALAVQVGIYVNCFLTWGLGVDSGPGDHIAELKTFVHQWLQVGYLLLQVATTAFVISGLPKPLISRTPGLASAILRTEVGYFAIAFVTVLFGDLLWAPADREMRQENQRALNQDRTIKDRNKLLKISETTYGLKRAVETADSQRIDAAMASLIKVAEACFEDDQDKEWRKALTEAGAEVQLHIATKFIDGELTNERMLINLENVATIPETRARVSIARTRNTIAEMYEETGGNRRKMGSLKYRVHDRVVTQLASAISDREHTSVQERIDLALAIEETADLESFDAKPAAAALRKVVESDDDERVRKVAAAALAKAEVDKDRS
jgi:hypothetical protein